MKKTARNYSVELLRFIFMVLILLQHYLVHGLEYKTSGFSNIIHSSMYPVHMGIMGISMIGVSGFMFISGYYGIVFKFDRLKSLWWQAAFYIIILGIAVYAVTRHMHGYTIFFFLPFGHGGWWYLSYYVIVFILAPIINAGITSVARKDLRTLIILMFGLLYIDDFLAFNYGTELSLLVFIYIVGRYVRLYGCSWLSKYQNIILVCGISILFTVPVLLGLMGKYGILQLFFSNYNPIVLITSISIVLGIMKWKLNKVHPVIASLLSNTLAIYLITDYRPVRYMIVDKVIAGHEYPFMGVILIVLIVALCCLIIEEIRKYLFKGINRIRIIVLEEFILGKVYNQDRH